MFGQTDAAQGHLEGHGVGPGDIFLFFGWFREVGLRSSRYSFLPRSPNLHVIYGWLEVGEVWHPRGDANGLPAWAHQHPHVAATLGSNNTVYVGTAGGVFDRIHPDLVLTAPDTTRRSNWRLPAWFHPESGRPVLSYHADPARWATDTTHCKLKSAYPGQEFVLDADHYPAAQSWIENLVSKHSTAH